MRRGALAVFYAGPLIVWMALIFVASTPAGGPDRSASWVTRLLLVLEPDARVTVPGVELSNVLGRKLAHLAEYAILGALSVRALQFGGRRLRWYALPGAFALCVLCAASDELHQRFVPGRTASVHDVFVDAAGAALAILALAGWRAVQRLEVGLWRHSAGGAAGPRDKPASVGWRPGYNGD